MSKTPLSLVTTLLTTLFILALSAAPTLAARGHAFSSTFSGPCTLEPCEGKLKEPDGVAVNEATGDIYVVDKGANRVARFSATGSYLGQFDGSGSFEVEGKSETGPVAGSGGHQGEIETGRFEAPEGIAVDNSCSLRKLSEPKCKEEDPSNGDVYVVDAGSNHRVLDKFSPTGEYVAQLSEASGNHFQGESLDGVAVDPEGRVWVYREAPLVDEFEFKTPVESELLGETRLESEFGLPGFAVDANDNLYVRHLITGDPVGRIAEVSSAGKVLIPELDPESSSAVSVEQTNGDSVLDNLGSIGVFDPAGTLLERLSGELSAGAGIGVDARTGFLYVADTGSDKVNVFAPVPPSAPTIESESISAITSESASLGGEIDPRSEGGEAATEYRFEYGACGSSSTCSVSGYEAEVPVPDGRVAPDFEVHAVSAPIQGLSPSTTYHFKLLAHNSHGSEEGVEKIFTTQSAGEASGMGGLPDHRGWELVSPPDKRGAAIEPIAEAGVIQAAADGDAITYLANAPVEEQPAGAANKAQVLSTRGVGSWSSRDISIPHSNATGLANGPGQEYKLFSPDLSQSVVQPFGEFTPQLSSAASEATAYLRNLTVTPEECTSTSACFTPLVTATDVEPAGTRFGEEAECKPAAGVKTLVFCGPEVVGASEDLSHVVLRSNVALKSGAGSKQLYEWAAGELRQVSILPNRELASEQPQLGLEGKSARGAISDDGTRIAWEASANLYLTDVAREESIELDEAETKCGAGACGAGGGRFQFASSDGSRVFFTDVQPLTEGSGAEPAAPGRAARADLYECQIVLEGTRLHCDLTDLTPANGSEGARVQGGVLGASADGAWIYFVADGVQSNAQNALGQSALAGKPNLYVRHAGVISFITRLSSGDSNDWREELSSQPTRVSPNGEWLELMSQASLTGYDNRDAASGSPVAEVYIYDASADRLHCASCVPTGARPVGVEYRQLDPGNGGLVGGPINLWPTHSLVAANVPGWTANASAGQLKNRYQPRYLNDEGRLFFDTDDALVPQDTNGTQDVYEYEPQGYTDQAGTQECSAESATFSEGSDGCVALISSGNSAQESAFLDASVSGDDVFFLTSARLSKLDTDASRDVYDAHVCSEASPCIAPPSSPAPACSSEATCGGAPGGPGSDLAIFGAPPSTTFSGPGNFAPGGRASNPAAKAKAKSLTRAQKLAKALKVCKLKKNRQKRIACERQARKSYGKTKPKTKQVKTNQAKTKQAKTKQAKTKQSNATGRGT